MDKRVTEPPDPHIGRLLRETFALFERLLHEGLHAAGATEIRPTHHAVLRHLDVDARRADPEDRRAKLVVYTERGLQGYRAGRRTIAQMEREFAALLGDEDYGRLRSGLERLMREG